MAASAVGRDAAVTETVARPPENDSATDAAAAVVDVSDPRAVETTIAGLRPATEYEIRVAAYGRKGMGLLSRPRRVRTKGLGERLSIGWRSFGTFCDGFCCYYDPARFLVIQKIALHVKRN
jgi:hypothetical protein